MTPSSPFAPKAPLEALLFESPSIGVGTFRCRPDHPLFRDSGPCSTYCFVFPRTSVWIQHAGGAPFVADPRSVTYYNAGQLYSRRRLSDEGDRGEWFAVAPGLADEIVREVAPRGRGTDADEVFGFTHGPVDATTYLEQRRLTEQLRRGHDVDPMAVEEQVIGWLAGLVPAAVGWQASVSAQRRRQTLVEDARSLLVETVGERVHLTDLAGRLSCSVFHLCRTFKDVQGTSMHAYRLDVRLRMALERIDAGEGDLTRVALDLGFCSHSHFTSAFRRQFGLTPSAYASRR